MAIVRYATECPGCKAGIVLRIGVGLDERQPFFYVCPQCSAATRGALLIAGPGETHLELSDGRLLDTDDDCKFTLHINPEFPAVPNAGALNEPGGSAFLMFHQLLGTDKLLGFQHVTAEIRKTIARDWSAIQRLTTYYLNRDWAHFDKAFSELLPSAAKPEVEWHRDHVLHLVYDSVFAPLGFLEEAKFYPEMKTAWNALWGPAHASVLVEFAREEIQSQGFRDIQRDLFSQVERYVSQVPALLPGLLINILPDQNREKAAELRLFRDDYEVLRDLYIQAFETCHKALRWVVGAANAAAHGDANKFVNASLKCPKDLAAFGKLVSAEKRKWLVGLPVWDARWDTLFDRHVRNDIGHASAHHQLATGLILRESRSPLPYTRFVAQVQRSIHGLLATLGVLKILRVSALMSR